MVKAHQWTVLLKHNEFTICSNEVLNGFSRLIGVANKIHYCCLDIFNVCSIYTYMYMVSAILRVIQISIPSDDLQKVFLVCGKLLKHLNGYQNWQGPML